MYIFFGVNKQMKFFEDKKNIIFSAAVFVLLSALAVTGFFLTRKGSGYNEVSAQLNQNKSSLSQAQSDIDSYSSQIESYSSQIESYNSQIEGYSSQLEEEKKAKEALQAELDKAKQEKEKLENEIESLKNQLLAKKRAEEQERLRLAILNCQQAGTQPDGKICYLTFDDGPSNNTLKILDILASYNIKATFFVVGNTGKLDYIKRIHAEGHTVGLHSDTHNYKTIYSSVDSYLADLNAISSKVESLIGIKSIIIRFPGGGSNKVSAKYCTGIMSDLTVRVRAMGYSYFDWNVDSLDASGNNVSASKIASSVINGAKNKNSVCVLMHDSSAKSTTVQALIPIIEGLYRQGFSFAPLTAECYGYYQALNN